MHQPLQPASFLRLGEHDPPQGGAVDRLGSPHRGTHGANPAVQHRPGGCRSRRQGLTGIPISIQDGQVEVLRQQVPHPAFAGGDAPGEANAALGWGWHGLEPQIGGDHQAGHPNQVELEIGLAIAIDVAAQQFILQP